jgi:hypothetical protein
MNTATGTNARKSEMPRISWILEIVSEWRRLERKTNSHEHVKNVYLL